MKIYKRSLVWCHGFEMVWEMLPSSARCRVVLYDDEKMVCGLEAKLISFDFIIKPSIPFNFFII
jgi:hypothetical protein